MRRSRRDLRTQFSKDAADLADKFRLILGHIKLAPAEYTPDLTRPAGPSTAGGEQALQHVRLVPAKQDHGATMVVGTLNQKAKTVELRTFEHLDAIHQQRFQRALDLDRHEYSSFLMKAQRFFEACGYSSTLAAVPGKVVLDATRLDEGPDPAARSSRSLWLVALGLAVLAAGAAWLAFR